MPHVSTLLDLTAWFFFEMTYNHKLESKTSNRSTDLAFMFGFQSICSQGSMAPPHCDMKQIENSSILHTRQRGTERPSHLAELTEHVRERKGLALHQLTLRIHSHQNIILKTASIGLQPKSVGHTVCSSSISGWGRSIGTSNLDLFWAGSLEFSLTTVAFLFKNCLGRGEKEEKIVTGSSQVLIIWRCEMSRDHKNVYTTRERREWKRTHGRIENNRWRRK